MPETEPTPERDRGRIARRLAEAMTAGPWRVDELDARAGRVLGARSAWLGAMAGRLASAFPARPTAARVAGWVVDDPGYQEACAAGRLVVNHAPWHPPEMSPARGAPETWGLPAVVTTAGLAAFLGLTPGVLDGLADVQGRNLRAAEGPLRHYRYRWQAKRSDPGSARLIEAPKPRLKALQRRLLDEFLALIPPHDAAHGFRPGRSVRSYVAPHAGRHVVLKLDLRDFFPTVSLAKVSAVFRTAGYPEPVARALAGLCTTRTPSSVWAAPSCPWQGPETWRSTRLYREPHLPQGAPTSPALANLCAHRLDVRLSALAVAAGASYTRYADDLAFSGGPGFERSAGRFLIRASAVALEEGFAVRPSKTRLMRRSVRQRVAGVVLNDRPNVARADFDRLKAVLHNCVALGPGGQNREGRRDFRAHLAGRVAHVASLNPERGRRLREVFDRIAW